MFLIEFFREKIFGFVYDYCVFFLFVVYIYLVEVVIECFFGFQFCYFIVFVDVYVGKGEFGYLYFFFCEYIYEFFL